ncbi:neutral/alkaline non-lysosomal ceramidase N-terminal domain-containing protein [Parapedobacter sp. DT-150]|uniref:neutral/alkaline non-lysosomal ceramidase N-terminal domain-containing protein n=1 Tax=Parapedobacter sp. DT-150 TaxID=3396162 RepID=UPI003F1BCB99
MNNRRFGRQLVRAVLQVMLYLGIANSIPLPASAEADPSWKAGMAKCIITPQQHMWMAGYAARNKPSSGKIHDLWAKVLVLEDSRQERVVFVSTDLLGFKQSLADTIASSIQRLHGVPRANVVLNSSHTHSGPVLAGTLVDIYPIDVQEQRKMTAYSAWLAAQLTRLVGEAIADLKAAQVSAGSGLSRIQVNRRNNVESEVPTLSELKGPNDFSVPLIKVTDASGDMSAILFGYACHPTVLSGYEWSGDYVGFAQLELEARYPGVQAMFMQGAGGDQNPIPRRTVALARHYGKVLAAAVECAIEDDVFTVLEPTLRTAYQEISLPFERTTDRAYLTALVTEEGHPAYFKAWAKRMLAKLDAGQPLDTAYARYPIQCVTLGQQTIFALGGELVTEYALRIKEVFGNGTFVFGYCNDVMGYIPSERILAEGGYEGADSQKVFGLPAKWATGIEQRILEGCKDVHAQVR